MISKGYEHKFRIYLAMNICKRYRINVFREKISNFKTEFQIICKPSFPYKMSRLKNFPKPVGFKICVRL
jgi:hypothetical protein